MNSILRQALRFRPSSAPWNDKAPVREELFGTERLEQHAESLAAAQPVTLNPRRVLSLQTRLNENADVLLAAYQASALELENGRGVVPAAEWLLDNYHVVEQQIRGIRNDLPPGYYRQLPKLAEGPFTGYPRVVGIAWAFVAHTDSHFDPDVLRRFLIAYQRVQPLTIGELWAVAITLRFVLIENLRRLADQMTAGRIDRADADALASALLVPGAGKPALEADIASRSPEPLSEPFAAQLAKRLRDQDPRTTPALDWLVERLRQQNTTVEEVVQHAQLRQGASNVSVRNVITSMRLISALDWAELFESVSLVDERLRSHSAFATMDFPTRNLYRSAIEQLARGSSSTEIEIADAALLAGREAASAATTAEDAELFSDPGYHLIGKGRRTLEHIIGFKPPALLRLSRFNIGLGIGGYVGAILFMTAGLLAVALHQINLHYPALYGNDTYGDTGLATGWLVVLVLAGLIPATEVATALVNRIVTCSFGAVTLPGLELAEGVPPSLRTLVVIPTLLTSEADILEQIERLEIHFLGGSTGDLTFALLTDGLDAEQEVTDTDTHLLAVASQAITTLNLRHGPGPTGARFLLLHRRRLFNASEQKWMGWERKRGKLHELNRLLRGATDTTFMASNDPDAPLSTIVPDGVRYVITLDADTRLPRDAALRLIGKMAHPLNRAKFSDDLQRVVEGYAILQPRVTPSLPLGRDGSVYQQVFSSPGGIDPYAAAVSDVYQDLFTEGSFTGKGIYDVDAFEASLRGRVPENSLLSHDLFEGTFARAGLASDVEVVEDFPSRYDVANKRQHRWTRGDWQLLPWIFGHWALGPTPKSGRVPLLGRWKMLDNLRRSLLAPFTLLAFTTCWLLPFNAALPGIAFILTVFIVPAFMPSLFALLPGKAAVRYRNHYRLILADLKTAITQTLLLIAFLPDQAWRMADAIVRTLVRLFGTRRHLLEWTTAAQSACCPELDLPGFYRQMLGGTLLGIVTAAIPLAYAPDSWPLVLPFLALWIGAPALAQWASRAPTVARGIELDPADADCLRLIARRTWRFFETFVTETDNMLPPDNFQDTPKPVVAHRTSPTNIGLYLLSSLTARDFGWASTGETVSRLEATLATMQKMQLFRGHFYNWYGTVDLRPLEPAYVSSVDSGNLAGHLIAVANACETWIEDSLSASLVSSEAAPQTATPKPDARRAIMDNLYFAHDAIRALPAANGERGRQVTLLLEDIDTHLNGSQNFETVSPHLRRLAEKAVKAVDQLVHPLPATGENNSADLVFWVNAVRKTIIEHSRERFHNSAVTQDLNLRLQTIANNARAMALAMDFAFLLDPKRKLLSIGYSIPDNRLDSSCYDLLASEARLASLFAIAKGDASTKHWFRLGRTATPIGTGSALISWSGSMFEYLMPSLVMRAPLGSLLEQTTRLVVKRQEEYGLSLGIPWGVSESAYNARDMEFTYQYSNFGVPGLGLKTGLSDNVVIAPYATGLATMVDARGACRNYARLANMGALGRYGYFEALDFTRTRLPDNEDLVIVRNFMAHHQGMTIVAIANTLHDGLMRTRFHREPMIKACELLLQERIPRNIPIESPRAEEVKTSATERNTAVPSVRRLNAAAVGANIRPVTHLLSNGRYSVMLTATGAGYSRWRDVAVTRWREDATRDNWGSFIFLRDTQSGKIWSCGMQPASSQDEYDEVSFGEDQAEFIHHDETLTTTMEVAISSEDDSEVRRVSLINSSRRARKIELTSYAEIVLTTPSADNAHPVFSKMFVQTEYLDEFGALIATRRPRLHEEQQLWAAHFAVIEGEVVAPLQYESDRARFIGRSRTIGSATAIKYGKPLSNTVGTVLDPIFSLRQRVIIQPGEVARVSFWTLVAQSRQELLDLIDKHHDRHAFDRARTLAWTQAQVQLRHLDVEPDEAADFQRLAAPILYADPHFRAASEAILRGAGAQSGLWPLSISGDLPIVLLRIDDIEDISQVRQLLRAHEYWRIKRLAVDLVIINERASSYVQDLQIAIETAVRSSQSRHNFGAEFAKGAAYALRADLLTLEARNLLQSVARVVLHARHGPLASQLADKVARQSKSRVRPLRRLAPRITAQPPAVTPIKHMGEFAHLEFFNGLGGFDKNGKEYVTILDGERTTPAPWINVISNPNFGFQTSTEGSGYTWAQNSRENQITPWSNDPTSDPAGEAIYVHDDETLDLWTATAQPIRDGGTYIARHGHGYSRFEHEANHIALTLLQYVPLNDPIKISRLTLKNLSDRPRQLTVTAYAEWVLGTARGASAPFITTEIDTTTGALLARNPWNTTFPGRVAFADLGGKQTNWTADRTEFLGRGGGSSIPAALAGASTLSKTTGAGFDPCAALQCVLEIGVGESVEVVSFIGQCYSAEEVTALIQRYRETDLDAVLKEVTDHWDNLLGTVQVKTPDRAMDIMLNGWLLYQTVACRIWARSAFYQASGAYGFRDQLQDGMALTFARPESTRGHLLRAAGRQFPEGDVQHWWLPHSGQGVRTHISDDRVWLAYATATYITTSGDQAVLDEMIPFLEGQLLKPEEHDAFFQPLVSSESASLFEHCARGLDQCILLTGEHGLPLIGTGDWNDGMSRVGEGGKGESVWLGWLFIKTVELFAPYAEGRDAEGVNRAQRWRTHALAVRNAIEQKAWDGEWYRRATFDDGTWLGSKDSDECQIDSIAQSWAILSGAADPAHAAAAMASVEKHLIRREDGMTLLFTPPFDVTPKEPGYIKGYPPGLRENGGQYSHAAMWVIFAFARMGAGDKAAGLFSLLNPINHTRTAKDIECYKVEPYAVAADVYSVAPHTGRGGWTWYTGAAGWMYRAGIDGILGLRREGASIVIDPCIPAAWPGYELSINLDSTHYTVVVDAPSERSKGITAATLDGAPLEITDGKIRVALDKARHELKIIL